MLQNACLYMVIFVSIFRLIGIRSSVVLILDFPLVFLVFMQTFFIRLVCGSLP